MINLKRAYEPPAPEDGFRVLVERLWPRGLKKEALALDLWLKEMLPARSCAGGSGMTRPNGRNFAGATGLNWREKSRGVASASGEK